MHLNPVLSELARWLADDGASERENELAAVYEEIDAATAAASGHAAEGANRESESSPPLVIEWPEAWGSDESGASDEAASDDDGAPAGAPATDAEGAPAAAPQASGAGVQRVAGGHSGPGGHDPRRDRRRPARPARARAAGGRSQPRSQRSQPLACSRARGGRRCRLRLRRRTRQHGTLDP